MQVCLKKSVTVSPQDVINNPYISHKFLKKMRKITNSPFQNCGLANLHVFKIQIYYQNTQNQNSNQKVI